MNGQLMLLRRLLKTVRSAKDFKELSRTIIFARKWKDRLSRFDHLMLLREKKQQDQDLCLGALKMSTQNLQILALVLFNAIIWTW